MSVADIIFKFNQGPRVEVHRLQSKPQKYGPDLIVTILGQVLNSKLETVEHDFCLENPSCRVYRGLLKEYPSALNGFQPQERHVAVKLATGQKHIESYLHEAVLYKTALVPLIGKVVPRFYGVFEGRIRAADVVCNILEWCGETFDRISPKDLREGVVDAVCKLHKVGVIHKKLTKDGGRDIALGPDNSIRIIDFSSAKFHFCGDTASRTSGSASAEGCYELCELKEQIPQYFNMIQTVVSKSTSSPPQASL